LVSAGPDRPAAGFAPTPGGLAARSHAVAALLYRDPDRLTPDAPEAIFAPADGVVIGVEDLYEHRFLHTDAVRVAIAASPFDVPFHRSPPLASWLPGACFR